MRAPLRFAVLSVALVAGGAACRPICLSSVSDSAGEPRGAAPPVNAGKGDVAPAAAANRAIAEADIVQLDQEQLRIYAMSRSGTLAMVDASQPTELRLLGKVQLAGEPFEMYRRGDVVLAMENRAVRADGSLASPLPEGAAPSPDPTASALVTSVDVSAPGAAKVVANLRVPGEIADSRVVGSVLYLVTYENAACWSCAKQERTLVTSFDVSDPLSPKEIDRIAFERQAPSGASVMPWKRSVVSTTERLYVGGAAQTGSDEGVIDVIDITDPTGHLVRGAKITVAGPIMSRWQMDEHAGYLRVVSQAGVASTRDGRRFPNVDTFRIDSSTTLVHAGHTTMQLPRQEGLKSVRFDGTRGYAITFADTDPLFTFDFSDPTLPVQRGELVMPGWVFHLEPRGDRLLGLGLDRRGGTGVLNVSLFDVADLSRPALVERVSFGPTNVYTDQEITNQVMAEDQDRIQKAFRIFQDGLIAVPFSALGYGSGDSCDGQGSGVQLLEWSRASLTRRGFVPMHGNPRRTVRRDSELTKELIAISDSNVTAFSIDERDNPVATADVVIGRCVTRPVPMGVPNGRMPDDSFDGWQRGDDTFESAGGGSSCF